MANLSRRATHAGDWYHADKQKLRTQLRGFLDSAGLPPQVQGHNIKAVLVPHAGFTYSGETAAYAYKAASTTEWYPQCVLSV